MVVADWRAVYKLERTTLKQNRARQMRRRSDSVISH